MIPGQRVFHPAFGTGRVISVSRTGPRTVALVDFGFTRAPIVLEALQALSTDEGTATDSQPTNSLDAVPAEAPVKESPTAPVEVEHRERSHGSAGLGGSATEARKGVTALRLGQVLETQVLELSVGTDRVQARLGDALTRALGDRPTFLLVDGVWGGGKTHALTLLQALARKENMATASAVMDGVAVTLSEPMQLMEEVVSSLRFPGSVSADSLGQFLRKAKRETKSSTLRARGADQVADALDSLPLAAFDDPEGLQCIEDYFSFSLSTTQIRSKLRLLEYEASAPPVLRARRVDDRPRAFAVLLKNWAQFSAVMGARGLLIVLDELDVEYASTAYFSKACFGLRARRRALLKQLKALSEHRAPLHVALASAPAGPDVETENDAVEDVREAMGPTLIHIKAANPNDDELKDLLSRLTALYQTAYPATTLELPAQWASDLFGGLHARYRRMPNAVPRHFVRTALEALDLLTVGEKSFDEVLQLLRASD